MPRYFIDVIDGSLSHHDVVGTEAASVEEVQAEAVNTLIDLFRNGLERVAERSAVTTIRADDGEILYKAKLIFTTSNIPD